MKFISSILYRLYIELGSQDGSFWFSMHGSNTFWAIIMFPEGKNFRYWSLHLIKREASEPKGWIHYPGNSELGIPPDPSHKWIYLPFLGIPFHLSTNVRKG